MESTSGFSPSDIFSAISSGVTAPEWLSGGFDSGAGVGVMPVTNGGFDDLPALYNQGSGGCSQKYLWSRKIPSSSTEATIVSRH